MEVIESITGLWPQIRQTLDIVINHLTISSPNISNIHTLNGNNMKHSFELVKRGLGPHPHGTDELRRQIHIAHGVLATTAVVIFFPTVAIILRVISSPHIVRLHWMLQLFNVGILLVAFGLGCWLSWLDGWLWHWPHQIIGTIIVGLFLIQPIFGFLQHRKFQRTGVKSFYSALHVWYGRALILLGMINGGLGLQLANNTSMGIRGLYAAIVVVVVLSYTAAQVWWYYKIRRAVVARAEMKEDLSGILEMKV